MKIFSFSRIVGGVFLGMLTIGAVWGYQTTNTQVWKEVEERLISEEERHYTGTDRTVHLQDRLGLFAVSRVGARTVAVDNTEDEAGCGVFAREIDRQRCEDQERLANAVRLKSTRACVGFHSEEQQVWCIRLVAEESALTQRSALPCLLLVEEEWQEACVDSLEGRYLAELGRELCETYPDGEKRTVCMEQADREEYLRTFQRRNLLPMYRVAQQAVVESRLDRCPQALLEDDPGFGSWCRVQVMKQFVGLYPERREELCGLLTSQPTIYLLNTDTFQKGVRVEQEVCMDAD